MAGWAVPSWPHDFAHDGLKGARLAAPIPLRQRLVVPHNPAHDCVQRGAVAQQRQLQRVHRLRGRRPRFLHVLQHAARRTHMQGFAAQQVGKRRQILRRKGCASSSAKRETSCTSRLASRAGSRQRVRARSNAAPSAGCAERMSASLSVRPRVRT